MFNNRNDISFLLVTHDDAESPVVVSKVQRKHLSAEDFPEMDADQIHEDLKVARCKKLLLIFMWVTDDELRLFMGHPEFVSWDITSQTNQEKCDLMAGSGKDGNGKLFSVARAFIPSQKWWVFEVFFRYCVPTMLNPIVLMRTKSQFTDGDSDCYIPLISAIDRRILGGTHSLCGFHGFSLPWKKKVTCDKLEGDLKHAHDWMRSWVFTVEYIAELDLSIEMFFKWIESNKIKRSIGEGKCTKIVDFARVNLLPMKSKLFLAYHLYNENLDERTTTASESMFSAIKKGSAAAKPSMSIDKSAMEQLKGTELRETKRKAHNATQISNTGLWTRLPTSNHLTAHMEGIACMLFD